MTEFNRLREVRKQIPAKEPRKIHDEMMSSVDRLKACEADVIRNLQKVDRYLVHRFLGYPSLFTYAVQALRLSEPQSLHVHLGGAQGSRVAGSARGDQQRRTHGVESGAHHFSD